MPVPIPGADAKLTPPDAAEILVTARAVYSASSGPDGFTDLQFHVYSAHISAMTGGHINPDYLDLITPEEFAEEMRYREESFRIRMVEAMLLCAFMIDPVPYEIIDRIEGYARELSLDGELVRIARSQLAGARELVKEDSTRAGYLIGEGESAPEGGERNLAAAQSEQDGDPELLKQWESLSALPQSTLGRGVWEFYRARGYQFPGSPGSASKYLAQHDWLHVIGDYGSTVESEIEVFGLISRANDDPKGFALLAMSVSLFQSGGGRSAGIFDTGNQKVSSDPRRIGIRLADAMYRGAIVASNFNGQDLLSVDWLKHAGKSIDEVREMIGIPEKSSVALRAGSVGAFDVGGITRFQISAGERLAGSLGVEYSSFGATEPVSNAGKLRRLVVQVDADKRHKSVSELTGSDFFSGIIEKSRALKA
ncbi:MAG: hypothetical protein WCG37_02735 [Actinomycetes bacterium]